MCNWDDLTAGKDPSFLFGHKEGVADGILPLMGLMKEVQIRERFIFFAFIYTLFFSSAQNILYLSSIFHNNPVR